MIDNSQWLEEEYKRKLELYFKGEIEACPQCQQVNGHHKMDCDVPHVSYYRELLEESEDVQK